MQESTTVLFTIFGIGITLSDIASIATAVSVVIGIFQLSAGRRVRVENAKRSAVKEAVNIAKLFQREILDGMTFIGCIYKETGFKAFVEEKIPKQQQLSFTKEEATSICGRDCKKIITEYEKKVSMSVLHRAAFFCPQFIFTSEKKDVCEGKKEIDEKFDLRNKQLEYLAERENLLNKLEWAAMLINSNVADGDTIYQSLHQTFFEFIHENYLHIAMRNTDANACDQYYTNITILYNNWIEKCNKQRRKERRRIKLQNMKDEWNKKRHSSARKKAFIRGPRI